MEWPFKHLKQNSTWPLQQLVVRLALGVLASPEPLRIAAAGKTIERCVRMGARLAVEFGMPASGFVELARAQIVREGGEVAQADLIGTFGDDVVKALSSSEEAAVELKAHVESILGKGNVPQA